VRNKIKECLLCGRPLPPRSGNVGRPREYHPKCKTLNQNISWLEDLIMQIEFTPNKIKNIRSELFRLSNLFNGRG